MLSAKLIRGAFVLASIIGIGAATAPTAHANPVVTLAITVYKDMNLTMVATSANPSLTTDGSGNYTYSNMNLGGVMLTLTGNTNSPGSSTVGQLLSNDVDVKVLPSGEDRWVKVVATTGAFSLPGSSGALVQVSSTISSDLNPANVTFNTTFNTTPLTSQTPTTPSVPTTLTQNFTRGATYTLSNTTVIHVTPTGLTTNVHSTGTSQVSALPEPSTLAMAGFGLPMLGLAAWRRRKAAKA